MLFSLQESAILLFSLVLFCYFLSSLTGVCYFASYYFSSLKGARNLPTHCVAIGYYNSSSSDTSSAAEVGVFNQ